MKRHVKKKLKKIARHKAVWFVVEKAASAIIPLAAVTVMSKVLGTQPATPKLTGLGQYNTSSPAYRNWYYNVYLPWLRQRQQYQTQYQSTTARDARCRQSGGYPRTNEAGEFECSARPPWTYTGGTTGDVSQLNEAQQLEYGKQKGWIGQDANGQWYEKKYPANCVDFGFCAKRWYATDDPLDVVMRKSESERRAIVQRNESQACYASGGVYGCAIGTSEPTCSCRPRATTAAMGLEGASLGFILPGPTDDLLILNALEERA
jgi:hypothetical protein